MYINVKTNKKNIRRKKYMKKTNEKIAAMLNKAAEVKLENYILIAIPTTIKDKQAPKETISKWVDVFAKMFTDCFGGYRCNAFMKGGFYDWTTNERVEEDNIDVWSRCTEEDLEKYLEEVLKMVEEIKKEMDQTAIYIEVKNGEDVSGYYI